MLKDQKTNEFIKNDDDEKTEKRKIEKSMEKTEIEGDNKSSKYGESSGAIQPPKRNRVVQFPQEYVQHDEMMQSSLKQDQSTLEFLHDLIDVDFDDVTKDAFSSDDIERL
ncbi:G-protein coupled receptor-associated protein [Dirofilaria immitis]